MFFLSSLFFQLYSCSSHCHFAFMRFIGHIGVRVFRFHTLSSRAVSVESAVPFYVFHAIKMIGMGFSLRILRTAVLAELVNRVARRRCDAEPAAHQRPYSACQRSDRRRCCRHRANSLRPCRDCCVPRGRCGHGQRIRCRRRSCRSNRCLCLRRHILFARYDGSIARGRRRQGKFTLRAYRDLPRLCRSCMGRCHTCARSFRCKSSAVQGDRRFLCRHRSRLRLCGESCPHARGNPFGSRSGLDLDLRAFFDNACRRFFCRQIRFHRRLHDSILLPLGFTLYGGNAPRNLALMRSGDFRLCRCLRCRRCNRRLLRLQPEGANRAQCTACKLDSLVGGDEFDDRRRDITHFLFIRSKPCR